MSFRVIAKGHHFAIYGEFAAAVRREQEQLATSGSGGAPLAKRSLAILNEAVTEVLRTAPHDCEVEVDLWGEREANGSGGLKLEVKFAIPEVAAAPVAEATNEQPPDENDKL